MHFVKRRANSGRAVETESAFTATGATGIYLVTTMPSEGRPAARAVSPPWPGRLGPTGQELAGESARPANSLYFADEVVRIVRNEQVALTIQGYINGEVEASAGGRSAIASDRSNYSRGGVLPPNPLIVSVHNEQVSLPVQGQPLRIAQAGGGGRAAITRETGCAIPRNGGNYAGGGIHSADASVISIGDK